MSDNKRPPGYVSLTIHELASSSKGRRGNGLDYVFGQDARAMDESVLGSSTARAVTGGGRPGPNGGRPFHAQNGGGQPGDQMQNNGNGGRRRNRRNNNRNRRGGRGDGAMFGREGAEGGDNQEWIGPTGGPEEGYPAPQNQQQNGSSYSDEPSGYDEE